MVNTSQSVSPKLCELHTQIFPPVATTRAPPLACPLPLPAPPLAAAPPYPAWFRPLRPSAIQDVFGHWMIDAVGDVSTANPPRAMSDSGCLYPHPLLLSLCLLVP
eukprot:1184535-Prorocentrum_minimum.AAC.5